MKDKDEKGTNSAPIDNIDACIRAAFAGSPRRNDAAGQDGSASVLNLLTGTIGMSVQLSLRDLDDEISPVVRAHGGSDPGSLLPERVGRYQIAGEIASGGVGSVFRAHDVDLGRDVAFKVLRERFAGNPDMTRRFLEEAQIGGQLQHPGIVAVHEMGLLAGTRPYFTMKLVKGRTLSSLLRERKSPADERQRFLGIFEQICQPIGYAHARGVVHRDLKPSNVMVGAFGEVQVMDWGLAKILARGGAEDDRHKTRPPAEETIIRTLRSGEGSSSLAGSVLGTPAYMAPEQARGDVDGLDETSDVFGLGAVLCEILTGEPPYRGESVEEVHRRARNGDLADAHARIAASGADVEILDLARRCLAFDRAARPRHAGTVAREVRQYLDSLESRAREARVRAARARLRAVAAAAAVMVVAAVGFSGLWLAMERRDARHQTASRARELMAKAEAHLAGAASEPGAMLAAGAAAREAFQTATALIDRDSHPGIAVELDRLGASVEMNIRRARFLAQVVQIGDGDLPERPIERTYDEAFKDLLGGHIFDLPRLSIVQSIQRDGLEVEAALVLDDWALTRRQSGDDWRPLVDISIAIDRSAARLRLWDLVDRGSPAGLAEHLARVEGVTASQLCSAAAWAEDKGDASASEKLYRRALELEPGRYRAHAGLGTLLLGIKGRAAEGLAHSIAAYALKPDSWWLPCLLARAHAKAGDAEGATRMIVTILASQSGGGYEASRCARILERMGLRFPNDGLDALIAKGLELARKDERFAPDWWRVIGAALVHRYCPREANRALEVARGEAERTHRRDPWILQMLSTIEAAAGRKEDAVRTLEEESRLAGIPSSRQEGLRELRRSVRPRLVSYASIDAALDEPAYLFEEDEPWRYFKGTRPPSAGDEWTRLAFDDSGWLESPSGIVDAAQDAAFNGMQRSSMDVYARRSIVIPDPSIYSRIVLYVNTDDGFDAWGNGELASAARMETGRMTPFAGPGTPDKVDLTGKLQAGRNVIAIRVGNETLGNPILLRIPVAAPTRAAASDAAAVRTGAVRAGVKWDATGSLEAYLDGRLAQERGEYRLAVERFRKTIELDRTAVEPFERLREAVMNLDGEEAAEQAYHAEVAKGAPVAILNTPPADPDGLQAREEGSELVLSAAPFRHADRRVEHAWTRWQVRTAAGDYTHTPTIDVLSTTRLTRFALPRHALAPRTQYFWRVTHFAAKSISAASTEATFTTGDYNFEAIRFDLAPYFNRDVIANPGDATNDYFDALTGRLLLAGFDGRQARAGAVGLPLDRIVGLHLLADYDAPNAIQLGPRSLLPIRIRAPGSRFATLRILVSGSTGDSIVPLLLEYADGGVEHVALRVDDWFDDPEPGPSTGTDNWLPVLDGGTPILNGLNRQWERAFDEREDAALFELTVPLDPARALGAVVIEPARMTAVHSADVLVNVFSIVGVRVDEQR